MPTRAATSTQSAIGGQLRHPTPAMTRVVQIEPGPMPTLTASRTGLDQRRVASPVATFAAMTAGPGGSA